MLVTRISWLQRQTSPIPSSTAKSCPRPATSGNHRHRIYVARSKNNGSLKSYVLNVFTLSDSQAGKRRIGRSLYRNDLTDLPVAMICRNRTLLKRRVVVTGGPRRVCPTGVRAPRNKHKRLLGAVDMAETKGKSRLVGVHRGCVEDLDVH